MKGHVRVIAPVFAAGSILLLYTPLPLPPRPIPTTHGCDLETPYCTTGVSLAVSAPKQVFAPNEPVSVAVTLTNRTQTFENISIEPEWLPFAYSVEKLRPDGCWQYLGDIFPGDHMKSRSDLWITLEHGKSHTQTVTVGISNFGATEVDPQPICDEKRNKYRVGASVYRAVFQQYVRATDVYGKRANFFGCRTREAIFEFEISQRSRTQPPQLRVSER